LSFATPAFKKVKESQGRERWLNATEIEVVRSVAPEEWWPFFALLIYTGIRVGEAQGLRWGDIQFIDRKIAIHTLHRGLKTPTSDRGVPIPEPLAVLIAAHATRFPADPTKPVFPGRMGNYWTALGTWRKIVAASGIAYCVMHDLRHTFGVHAARAGVPLARLQKLMGHAHPHMTLRYMRHVPDGDFAKDAASVAQSMVDRSGAEGDARAVVARSRLGVA
jgi:integrase